MQSIWLYIGNMRSPWEPQFPFSLCKTISSQLFIIERKFNSINSHEFNRARNWIFFSKKKILRKFITQKTGSVVTALPCLKQMKPTERTQLLLQRREGCCLTQRAFPVEQAQADCRRRKRICECCVCVVLVESERRAVILSSLRVDVHYTHAATEKKSKQLKYSLKVETHNSIPHHHHHPVRN